MLFFQEKDFSFKVQVIDLKTMNFIKFENVKVINEKLIHTTYKNVTSIFINYFI